MQILTITPKPNTSYNPLHEDFAGAEVDKIYANIGERGYIYTDRGTIHTSAIKTISDVTDNNNDVILTIETLNTFYIIKTTVGE